MAVAIFVWASVAFAHLSISEVLVLALILYRLLPLMQSLQQAAQQVLHTAPSRSARFGTHAAMRS